MKIIIYKIKIKMGGGCACNSNIKKYFFCSTDCILKPKNQQDITIKNNKNKVEKNIKIIPIEDNDNKSNIIQNSDKTKIQINKNNIFNNSNIKVNNSLLSIEDNKKKGLVIKNNSSSFDLCSDISKKNINNKANNKINNNNKLNNKNENINNSKHKIIQKKLMENELDKSRKTDTNYNYNLGDHNFIFINISQGSSFLKNDSKNFQSTSQKEHTEDKEKGNEKLFSLFKNKIKEKSTKNQSNTDNIFIKPENINMHLYMNNYSEEMLNFINSIRKSPESFIKYIDNVINNNIQKINDDIYIVSKDVEEKIKLMDNYLLIFEQIKKELKEIINSKKSENLEEFIYNKELEIVLDKTQDLVINRSHFQRSSLSNDNDKSNIIDDDKLLKKKKNILNLSDDKIANFILEKRKQIKDKYPDSIFKLNIIKDIKINVLIQVSMESFYSQYNDKTILEEIIFNPKYKNFAVSWANEINRNFISISCFA